MSLPGRGFDSHQLHQKETHSNEWVFVLEWGFVLLLKIKL